MTSSPPDQSLQMEKPFHFIFLSLLKGNLGHKPHRPDQRTRLESPFIKRSRRRVTLMPLNYYIIARKMDSAEVTTDCNFH